MSKSPLDQDLFAIGLEKRKATLGAEYVSSSLENADELSRPFQADLRCLNPAQVELCPIFIDRK